MKHLAILLCGFLVSQAHALETTQTTTTTETTATSTAAPTGMTAPAATAATTTATAVTVKETTPSSLRIAPMIGLTAASVDLGGPNNDSDLDNGLSIGATADIGTGRLVAQTGIIYNQLGGKWSNGDSQKLKLSYLSIPVLAKYNVTSSTEGTFFIKAGLMPGYLMSQYTVTSQSGAKGISSDFSYRSFDIPLVGGLGASMPISANTAFIVDAEYMRSLTKISRGPATAKNEGFIFSTGIAISL